MLESVRGTEGKRYDKGKVEKRRGKEAKEAIWGGGRN